MRSRSFIIFMLLGACQLVGKGPSNDDNDSTVVNSSLLLASGNHQLGAQTAAPISSVHDVELKISKLWARVDELETLSLQQRERITLLEKGLMLGIVPEELKRKSWKNIKRTKKDGEPVSDSFVQAVEDDINDKKVLQVPVETHVVVKSKDVAEYKRMIQAAQEKFNSSNYGQAISIFNDIGEKFDDSLTEGSQLYWIGLGWFYLKEFQLAEQSFQHLKDHYSQNRWVSFARFYLAKIDYSRGLHNRSLEQMKKIMEEFSSQDVGEMARQEVQKMRENL